MTDRHLLNSKRALVRIGDSEEFRNLGHARKYAVSKPRLSTDELPIAPYVNTGNKNGMALIDIVERIEKRLKAVSLSASAASLAAGMSKDTIRNWKRKLARGESHAAMSVRSLERLALVLETSVHWLQTGEGPETERSHQINTFVVPLLPWDLASLQAEKAPESRLILFAGLPGTSSKKIAALRVNDESMNMVSPVDSIIFVDRAEHRLFDGAFYVLATPDGTIWYRQYLAMNRWHAVSARPLPPVTGGPITVIGRVIKTELTL